MPKNWECCIFVLLKEEKAGKLPGSERKTRAKALALKPAGPSAAAGAPHFLMPTVARVCSPKRIKDVEHTPSPSRDGRFHQQPEKILALLRMCQHLSDIFNAGRSRGFMMDLSVASMYISAMTEHFFFFGCFLTIHTSFSVTSLFQSFAHEGLSFSPDVGS